MSGGEAYIGGVGTQSVGDTRRASERARVEWPAQLESSGGIRQRGICSDISIGGLGLVVGFAPFVGDSAVVILQTPAGEVRAEGQVVRVSGLKRRTIGIRFSELTQNSLDSLHKLLRAA